MVGNKVEVGCTKTSENVESKKCNTELSPKQKHIQQHYDNTTTYCKCYINHASRMRFSTNATLTKHHTFSFNFSNKLFKGTSLFITGQKIAQHAR